MRDRFEIVCIDEDQHARVLSRSVPNKYAKRWKMVKALAVVTIGAPLEEANDNKQGLLFAVRSPFHRSIIGIRERE